MTRRKRYLAAAALAAVLALGAGGGLWASGLLEDSSRGAEAVGGVVETGAPEEVVVGQVAGPDPVVLQYAAKFTCLEPLPPGTLSVGSSVPIVQEKTDVLIHNPNPFPVTLYKKAVRAPLEDAPPVAPGPWKKVVLEPDYAVRADCDDVAKLLTGNPTATFIGTYGIGVKVEGFVVVAIGPQPVGAVSRTVGLDVTADYVRGSEVLKKDISYQPWWWWWGWPLPWRLGYPYERLVTVNPAANIDCRGSLVDALILDANEIPDAGQRTATQQALNAGRQVDPTRPPQDGDPPSLVALVGKCDKLDPTTAEVDYVLLSNKAPTDGLAVIAYPWIPGRWYDLPVVMPQNRSTDLDAYIRDWHKQRWIDAGLDAATVQSAMVYFFPWWCGWGYWWWWWAGDDCTDIGVGEGESLDVERVTPQRVLYPVWPPP